jgi:hypothetical protein
VVEDGSRDENNKSGVRAPLFELLIRLRRLVLPEKTPTYPTPPVAGL